MSKREEQCPFTHQDEFHENDLMRKVRTDLDIAAAFEDRNSKRRAEAPQESLALGTVPYFSELAALKAELARRDALIEAIYSSRSWRITKPLRWLSIRLLGRPAPATLNEVQSFTAAVTDLAEAMPPTAVEGKVRVKPGRSGWVLIAAHFPPLYDQQGDGLRLKFLIDVIGEQGWPMVFASRSTKSELPGVLSTEAGRVRYETALRKAGVVHFAYGIDEVDAMIAELGTNLRYAFLSFPQVAHDFIPCVRAHCPTATIIYDMVNFHAVRMAREAVLKHDTDLSVKAEGIKAVEVTAARTADITIAISSDEKSRILDLVPGAVVEILPTVVMMPTTVPAGLDERSGLFFVGGFWHLPNGDGVTWFVEKIWPRIRSQIPECRLSIAGSNPTDEVLALATVPGIEVLGFVPDLTPLFDSARVFIAPLRYGAGVKCKIAQSLMHGLPVVTTSIGAEGIDLVDGEHALIADDPDTFASQVVRLLGDDGLWAHLQTQGRALARSAFSVESVREKMAELFDG